MKILIVDDSVISRDIFRATLVVNGYRDILEAKDGKEGLEVARENYQDIALYVLDINMPRMDGLHLLEELRKFDRKTPVIMLTTETDQEKVDRARTLGATGWIVKPFKADKMINVINMVLK